MEERLKCEQGRKESRQRKKIQGRQDGDPREERSNERTEKGEEHKRK